MSTFVASAGLETAPLQDGAVLYEPKTGRFVMLNRSASFLWTQLSTPKTEEELVDLLGSVFPGTAVAQDVKQALEQLQQMELVASNGEAATPAPHGNGQERKAAQGPYERPSLRVLDEEELLNIFQMTAAEISVASCWWIACPSGCP